MPVKRRVRMETTAGPIRLDRPRIVDILETRQETPLVTTLCFMDRTPASPGQYYMIWVPGVDEVPMSICHIGEKKGIAVHAKGVATRALAGLSPGERIGVRGPYGRGFTMRTGRALVVAGGTGIACLSPLVEMLAEKGPRPTVVLGAKTGAELLFVERNRSVADVVITTDDGTAGRKGLATDAASGLLEKGGFKQVFCCGPELMMRKVAQLAHDRKLPVQLALERYMKCGMGICDSCAMGGVHICVEGPVLEGSEALKLAEFGSFRRDSSGRMEKI
jgi:dihydroorotate dehydrogenase electron transfer subunit